MRTCEICVLSTKSYTSQLAILHLLAYATADKAELGKERIEFACSNVNEVIDTNLEYYYGFVIHHKDEPIHFSADNADLISDSMIAISLDHANIAPELFEPIIKIGNPAIRISSLRVRDDAVLVTMYNIENKVIECQVSLTKEIQNLREMKIDGSVSNTHHVNEGKSNLSFNAREIKMCRLERA